MGSIVAEQHIDRLYFELVDVLPEADYIVSVLPSTIETQNL
ncbi:hypothetical protein [Peribacillus butanolivorans]|nr:hypothetical protein [Peribacillus butanolivorans]